MSYGPTLDMKSRSTSVADEIKKSVAAYYYKKGRMSFFELGLTWMGRLRADVFVLAMNGYIVIVEVKSSLADFRSDKKMKQYEEFCNASYCAMPESVYLKVKDKILPGWGCFVMNEDGTCILKVKGAKPFDIDPEITKELCIRAAYREADTNKSKNKRFAPT
jgi:hypothetical protein